MAGEGLNSSLGIPASSDNVEQRKEVVGNIRKSLCDIDDFKKYLNASEENKWRSLRDNPSCIGMIEEPTFQMCSYAVGKDPNLLKSIPRKFRDYGWCKKAIEKVAASEMWFIRNDPREVFNITNPMDVTLEKAVADGGMEILDEMVQRGLVERGTEMYIKLDGIVSEHICFEEMATVLGKLQDRASGDE